jgi:hypothetical protein
MLAVAGTAILLASRSNGRSYDPERFVLKGRTEHGKRVALRFNGAELWSFSTLTSMWCPTRKYWQDGIWDAQDGASLARFHNDGRRFVVRHRSRFRHRGKLLRLDYTLRGRLAEDERSAAGVIAGDGVFGAGRRALTCTGTVRFRARR